MKIVVIHEVSYTKKPVNEFQDFSESLSSIGHDVSVIDFDESEKNIFKISTISRTGKSSIRLINMPNLGFPIIKYFYAQIFFYFFLKKMIKENKVDVIFLYSVFINGMSAVFLGKKNKIPTIYRVLDAYHLLRKNKIDSLILKYGEMYIYRNASKLSLTNSKMSSYVSSMAGFKRLKNSSVLEHGVDCKHFSKGYKDISLLRQLGISNEDFVCIFLGTTYSFSRIDLLIPKIRIIKKIKPNFKLLIIGAGDLDKKIKKASIKNQCELDVIQVGMIGYHDLPKYLSLGDIGINPFEINHITRDIVPIKILQYQSSALPVISTPLPDLINVIPRKKSGVEYSQTDSIEDFTKSLIELINRSDLALVGKQARNYVKKFHSIEKTINELDILVRGF